VLAAISAGDALTFMIGRYTPSWQSIADFGANIVCQVGIVVGVSAIQDPQPLWILVMAYVAMLYVWWNMVRSSQVQLTAWTPYLGAWAPYLGFSPTGYASLLVYSLAVALLDWGVTRVVHKMSSLLPANHGGTLRVILIFPLALGTTYFAALLFLNSARIVGLMIVALFTLRSFPLRTWKLVCCGLHLWRLLLGRVGPIDARQEIQRGDSVEVLPILGKDGMWLMTHSRFRGQVWGVLLAGVALTFDYFQPTTDGI